MKQGSRIEGVKHGQAHHQYSYGYKLQADTLIHWSCHYKLCDYVTQSLLSEKIIFDDIDIHFVVVSLEMSEHMLVA